MSSPKSPLTILYADNHLLVIDKPVGIATMGSPQETDTIARQAALYLQRAHNKPGKAFIGVVSRLDRLVSGVLVLARTSKAASRLSEQLRQQTVGKIYLAIVEGSGIFAAEPSERGHSGWREVVDWVAKDESSQRMRVVEPSHPQAQLARLRFQLLASSTARSLLKIELLTGRKHQIRLQLAEQGTPICGDRKYGASGPFGRGIALHCQRITLNHPTLKEKMVFESSPLHHWPQLPVEFRQQLELEMDR